MLQLLISYRYGTYSTSEAVNAGLDLEMPGPARWRGNNLLHAILSNKVTEHTLNTRVRNVLNLVNDACAIGVPENAKEMTRDTPQTRRLLRQLAGESIVLMRNDKSVLPLDPHKTVSLIFSCEKSITLMIE